MPEIARSSRAASNLLLRRARPYACALVQPLITVGMLLFLYAGWHVRDEGNIGAGLRVAFVDTRAFRAQHQYEAEAAELQLALRHSAETDRLIDRLLSQVMARSQTAARVWLGIVHNGITGVTGVALLRVDITNAVASPGHSAGSMPVNLPLSDWNDFLPVLLSGQCLLGSAKTQPNLALRARLDALGADAFLACPVIDVQGRMLGAMLMTWDITDLPPTGEPLRALSDYSQGIATQIAFALEQRGRMSPRTGANEAQ